MGNEQESTALMIQPDMTNIPRGQEAATIGALIACTRAVMAAPRDRKEIIKACEDIAVLFAETDAKKARYAFPLGGKTVSGIASPLAKAILHEHGNVFVATSVDNETDEEWLIRATLVDVHRSSFLSTVYRQRKCAPGGTFRDGVWASDSGATIEKDRVLSNMFATGQSKAMRNAVEDMFPLECSRALKAAEKRIAELAKGAGSPSNEEWLTLSKATQALGVTREQLEIFVGKTMKNWGRTEYQLIADTVASIDAGEISVTVFNQPASVREESHAKPA